MVHVLILGGGLTGCLVARKVRQIFPHRSLLLLEQSQTLGGQHLNYFLGAEVTHDQKEWLSPLIHKTWTKSEVHFSSFSKVIDGNVYGILPSTTHSQILKEIGAQVRFNTSVDHVSSHQVQLSSGEVIEAELIIDARGFSPVLVPTLEFAYQNFVSATYELKHPHGIENAILMDAITDQSDVFRYFSLLPLDVMAIQIKEVTFSKSINFDSDLSKMKSYIDRSLASIFESAQQVRLEKGFVPLFTRGNIHATLNQSALPLVGARGGMFHPVTGHSVPILMSWLDELSRYQDWTTEGMKYWTDEWIRNLWDKFRYYQTLNRIFFENIPHEKQVSVYEKMFQHPNERIQRFYAARLNFSDKVALLYRRPGPVSIRRSISQFLSRSV